MRARGEEKAASVASGIDFPRTHPNLATGATAAARARTVLRAAETLAPARKRHWTAEIADIVAGGCECGYEPGDYARFDFELGPDQDKTLPGRVTRERLFDRAAALSQSPRCGIRSEKTQEPRSKKSFRRNPNPTVWLERERRSSLNSSEDSSEGSIGNSIGKTGGRSEARKRTAAEETTHDRAVRADTPPRAGLPSRPQIEPWLPFRARVRPRASADA